MENLLPIKIIMESGKNTSPGIQIADRLYEEKARSGVPMTKVQVANVIDAMLKELGYSKKRTRVGGRDVLFDALCVACGVNPHETTRIAAEGKEGIGAALADIVSVTPNITPEEFGIRANKYRRIHPDWDLTPFALCKFWGELGSGDIGQTVASMHAAEPQGWQEVARMMFLEADWSEDSIKHLIALGWANMALFQRKAIQNRINSNKVKGLYERQDQQGDSRRDGVDA